MNEILIPIYTCLIGLFIGHRFTLFRDKRKEFNEVSQPIFEELEVQFLTAKQGRYPCFSFFLSEQGLIPFKSFLSVSKK